MEDLCIRPYHHHDQESIIEIWRKCGLIVPQNNPFLDIHRKLQQQPELFLVGTRKESVVASCMAGYDGHRAWINYLAVTPNEQRKGIASKILHHAEGLLAELACPKINLQIRSSNAEVIKFYQSLGYLEDPVISMGKRIVRDDRPFTQNS